MRHNGARHLLSMADLDRDDIEQILNLTGSFAEVGERSIPKVPALRGKTIAWLFYEDSTRTRLSFETAAKRLSADTMNFSVSSSSVNKGESLRDTIETIAAMGIDGVVVRHRAAGAPQQVADWTDAAVINAGDGWHQHPTQALLDLYTATSHLGDLLWRPGSAMPDDDTVNPHRRDRLDRVPQRVALVDRRTAHAEIHRVGRESLDRRLEAETGAG